MTKEQIRLALKTIQLRRRWGDSPVSFVEIAQRAGVHRDTLYSLLEGHNINITSQYGIGRVLRELENPKKLGKTKVMHVAISTSGVKLGFGVGKV